jgi:DNA-binding helix-hairpin-helix protein with protein kinase domain
MRLHRVSNNAPVTLGKELGRGGEGAVFPVAGSPDLVAKIYLKLPAPAKAEKLRSMARNAAPQLLRAAAWPVDVLADEAGAVRGFLMPKVSAREDVHELYSPKSRRRAFPSVDFRFVVRVAANIARSFAQVHAAGNVIGDVNHGNALVGRDGTVVLIDCDSFQIRDGARLFTCDVGVPLFTPPELMGQGFRGLKRTANHDAFGLAVLIFHMLYLGRHPFAGTHDSGDMPIERAIAESRFVYGAKAAEFGMSRPPGTLTLGTFGESIERLFEQAFAPPSEARRPSATQWIGALQALENELAACAVSPAHFHPRAFATCCWCTLEQGTGVKLFGGRSPRSDASGTVELAQVWDAISAIPSPGMESPLEGPDVNELDCEARDPLGPAPRAVLATLLALLGVVSLAWVPGSNLLLGGLYFAGVVALGWKFRKPEWRKDRNKVVYLAMLAAREQLSAVIERWNKVSSDEPFVKLLGRLEETKRSLLALAKEREARIKLLVQDAVRLQREHFLDGLRIDKAKIPGITPQEIAKLSSYGIETALDVLQGGWDLRAYIREVSSSDVMAWAEKKAQDYRFDPSMKADGDEIRDFDETLHRKRELLLSRLREGAVELERVAAQIASERAAAKAELAFARQAVSKVAEGQET